MRTVNVKALLGNARLLPAVGALRVAKRHTEYWGSTVSSRTQAYAQGDLLPRLDNTRHVINKSTGEAAVVTGNHLGIAYSTENIFNVEQYSSLERDHYKPLRGIDKYKIEPMEEHVGSSTSALMETMKTCPEMDLNDAWWARLFKDFPSLRKPFDPTLQAEFESFYIAALAVAHDDAAVTALASPFVERHNASNFLSYAIYWRIAEKLADALEMHPSVTRYSKLSSRVAVERVTKLMMNTLADKPWSHSDATSPLLVDVSNFRPWHEAGYW